MPKTQKGLVLLLIMIVFAGGITSSGLGFIDSFQLAYADSAPICTTGTFNPVTDKCEVGDPACPLGTYEPSIDSCVTSSFAPLCTTGIFNPVTDECESAPSCVLGTYNSVLNQCVTSVLPNCGGATLNPATDQCEKPPVVIFGSTTCLDVFPVSFTLVGGTCVADPSCISGTYNSLLNECVVFSSSASCLGGALNTATDKCESTDGPLCFVGAFSSAADSCITLDGAPMCIVGTLSTSSDKCEAPFSCPVDTQFDTNVNLCLANVNGQVIGGNLLPVDAKALLVAGVQTNFSWIMLFLIPSVAGLVVLLSRKK